MLVLVLGSGYIFYGLKSVFYSLSVRFRSTTLLAVIEEVDNSFKLKPISTYLNGAYNINSIHTEIIARHRDFLDLYMYSALWD